jgi:hypothetical protein
MSQIIIDIGAAPDDSLGTPLRQAFADVNQMFSEVYLAGPVDSTVRIANNAITTTVINSNLVLNPNGIGKVQVNNGLLPAIDDVYDLGSPTQRFNTVYIGTGGIDLDASITISGTLRANGNIIAGQNFIGNGALLTGIVAGSSTQIQNGNTAVAIAQPNAPVTIAVDSVGNVAVFATTGVSVTGAVTATGNISGEFFIGNGSQLTGLAASYGNANVAAFLPTYTGNLDSMLGNVVTTGNVRGGNISSLGAITATGNVTASYFVGNATLLDGVLADRGAEPSSNWNNIEKMGVYTVNRTSWAGTQNTPIDSQVFVGMLEVKNSSEQAIVQTFWPGLVEVSNIKLMWVRNYWDGNWTAWQKMVNGNQVIDGGDQF